jgi:hypothetical protein
VCTFGPQRKQKGVAAFNNRRHHDDRCHFGAAGPTGTGWIHACLPFDSITLART